MTIDLEALIKSERLRSISTLLTAIDANEIPSSIVSEEKLIELREELESLKETNN